MSIRKRKEAKGALARNKKNESTGMSKTARRSCKSTTREGPVSAIGGKLSKKRNSKFKNFLGTDKKKTRSAAGATADSRINFGTGANLAPFAPGGSAQVSELSGTN